MYKKAFLLAISCCFISFIVLAQKKQKKKDAPAPAAVVDTTKKTPPKPPKATIAEKTKSSKKTDGLFTIYQDTATGSVQLYIKKDQLGKEYIYQSFSMGGPTRLYLNQNMIEGLNHTNRKSLRSLLLH